jgi:hypothetical protein
MIKGCQRKIIYLKDTGSNAFDEAYFILKSDAEDGVSRGLDLVGEAKRIAAGASPVRIHKNTAPSFGDKFRWFLTGVFASLSVGCTIYTLALIL